MNVNDCDISSFNSIEVFFIDYRHSIKFNRFSNLSIISATFEYLKKLLSR